MHFLTLGMQGKKQFQEKLFTTFQLSDHVPEDNFYRRLKELIPLQWRYSETAKYYGTEGCKALILSSFLS